MREEILPSGGKKKAVLSTCNGSKSLKDELGETKTKRFKWDGLT